MCRVDERVYVRADGHRSVFQDSFMCDRGKRRGRVCHDAEVRRTEYPDPTSSPIASSPLTPNGPRTRRFSTSSRPSTRDGPITSLTPEIHIEIGSSKKGKTKMNITTGKTKRASGGSSSAYDSPSSEASHTVRTGFPDISPPPLNRGGLQPSSAHYRNPSSDESISGSSRVTHTYRTSEGYDGYDTPSLATGTTATSSATRPIIHDQRRATSSTNSTRGHAGSPSSSYRTAEVRPSGLYMGDSDYSRSSSTYAPEITGRDQYRQERRDEKKRQQQEAIDAEVAASLIREENTKQVRFDTGRANPSKVERAHATSNTPKVRQPDDRREPRRQEARREAAEAAAQETAAREAAAAKRSKPSTTVPKPTRRGSVRKTSAQAAEQAQLLAVEREQMHRERIRVDALEREERAAQESAFLPGRNPPGPQPTLQELQQDREYYNPRGNGTPRAPQPPVPAPQPPIIRRPSQVNQPRPTTLRRPSFGTQESAAPPQRQTRGPPPLSSYWNSGAAQANGLPSARPERRPSSSHGSNPFTPTTSAADPWDSRTMRDALPSARGAQVGYNLPPQQATQRMQQAVSQGSYPSAFDSDSEEDQRRRYDPRKR
ncbi:hypothetical protein E8E13_006774 [Curvularia kusanoi]|uniref:Uncharacterized protein n=1 Tax=Curvularia kusanoi TaxID=90978 RepID=A0A9P4W959_CURKU|nr:hypothetical protein E8E13_006774 [Curvularia kusanoi]